MSCLIFQIRTRGSSSIKCTCPSTAMALSCWLCSFAKDPSPGTLLMDDLFDKVEVKTSGIWFCNGAPAWYLSSKDYQNIAESWTMSWTYWALFVHYINSENGAGIKQAEVIHLRNNKYSFIAIWQKDPSFLLFWRLCYSTPGHIGCSIA